MSIATDLTIFEQFMAASLLVKLVIILLALLSLMSWYWIFRKWFQINSAQAKANRFERDFWSGGDLDVMYQAAAGGRFSSGGMER
ncbi:MAG: protein TolQ, partial [Azoarcus sp.]|nr:protein TolQ [Azoarcus sp.]